MISRRIAQTAMASALAFTMCTAALCEMASDDSDENKGNDVSVDGSGDGTGSANQEGNGDTHGGNGGTGTGATGRCTEITAIEQAWLLGLDQPGSPAGVMYRVVSPNIGDTRLDVLAASLRKGEFGWFELNRGINDLVEPSDGSLHHIVWLNTDCEEYWGPCERRFTALSGSIFVDSWYSITAFNNVVFYENHLDSGTYLTDGECFSANTE